MDEIRDTVKSMDQVLYELTVLADHARKLMKDLYDEIYRKVCVDLPTVFGMMHISADWQFPNVISAVDMLWLRH